MSKKIAVLIFISAIVVGAYMVLNAWQIVSLQKRVNFLEKRPGASCNCSEEDINGLIDEVGYLKEDIWQLIGALKEKQVPIPEISIQTGK